MDRSHGYERVSKEFLAYRGDAASRSTAIGVRQVRAWARTLPSAATVIDIGCGPGFPITVVLVEEGLQVFAIDASPSLVAAFQRNLPNTPVLCESILESDLFDRTFDAALSIGLVFLLNVREQEQLIRRFGQILKPGGHVLFTSPAIPASWRDAMTGLESVSLGADRYRNLLADVGLSVVNEYEDAGENHYFEALKKPGF